MCPRCKSKKWDAPVIRPVRRGSGPGIAEIIAPERARLVEVLRAHHAANARVFGSVAWSEARRDSDLDLLVDFDAGATAFDQMDLIAELEEIFHRKVDVTDPEGLHWLVRPQALFEAVPV